MKTPLADDYLKIAESLPQQGTDTFFYTRLKARMEKAVERKNDWNFSFRPSILIGLLAILLIVNGFLFTRQQKTLPENSGTELQTFASSYDLTITTPY